MLKDKVLQTIKENDLIKRGDKIILGISGGPDSVCLFSVLNSLKKELGIKIILTHVNYNFRGDDSKIDERFVRKLAYKSKTKIHIKNIDPKDYEGVNLEECFRNIRYDFFTKILKLERAQKIAVAHNKDDQVETILMFFLRGSGLSGISGMKIKNNKIIRPLFNLTKKDILAYLKENKIEFRKDKTNKDPKFTRNKIRHRLIPFLETKFNPNIKNALFENAKIIRDDQDLLLKLAEETFKSLAKKEGVQISINLKKFNKLHPSLKNRLLGLVIKKFNEDVSLSLLKEILKTLKYSRGGAKKYVGELKIVKNYDKIVFRKRGGTKKIKLADLKINGEIKINISGVKIKVKKVDKQGKISENKCYIDLKKTGQKLFVRSRKKGDRFYPKGIRGSQKLKDFFINNKITSEERDLVPLIINNKDEIVWVGGYRLDRRFKADEKSKDVLEIRLL